MFVKMGNIKISFFIARVIFLVAAVATTFIFVGLELNASATVGTTQPDIRVFVDAVQVGFPDQQPIISSGRTLVPLRFVSEDLGATVTWDGATNSVTMVIGNTRILLTIGRHEISVNGVVRPLDVPAQIIGGRTMVPIRGIFESLGATVAWDQAANAVIITRAVGQNPGRIAFDPAIHINPNHTMNTAKAIEFAVRAFDNARFVREPDGRLFFDWVYVEPVELVGTGFVVDLLSVSLWGQNSAYSFRWVVGDQRHTHSRFEVPAKQNLRRELTGLRDFDGLNFLDVRVAVRRTIPGTQERVSSGHLAILWSPRYGISLPRDMSGWIFPNRHEGPDIDFDIRRLITWLR